MNPLSAQYQKMLALPPYKPPGLEIIGVSELGTPIISSKSWKAREEWFERDYQTRLKSYFEKMIQKVQLDEAIKNVIEEK